MAHFAKIGLNNKVIGVHRVHNNELKDANGVEKEDIGINFLTALHGWAIWKKTSYNTRGGVHIKGGTPFRKNYAGIGWTYDEDRDAFIPPRNPHPSWVFNEDKCLYDPPIPPPNDGQRYYWDEEAHQADNTTGWELSDTGP